MFKLFWPCLDATSSARESLFWFRNSVKFDQMFVDFGVVLYLFWKVRNEMFVSSCILPSP